jgi:hypothetical protein
MTAVRQTYQVSLRYLRALARQPAFLGIALVQPIIWLLLFGALFKAVTRSSRTSTAASWTACSPRPSGGQRETLIGAVMLVLLPLTFLSSALMEKSLAPDWIQSVARFNPVDWAAEAGRSAATGSLDWGLVAPVSGCSPPWSSSRRRSRPGRSGCTSGLCERDTLAWAQGSLSARADVDGWRAADGSVT